MAKSLPPEPVYPFVVMNEHYIVKWHNRRSYNYIDKKAFENGRFKDKAIVIDVHCRRFEVLDVVKVDGFIWNPEYWFTGDVRVKYIYGPPEQLSFDEARSEIMELIYRRRFRPTGENEAQLRARNDAYTDIRDILDGISFAGNKYILWPKRSKPKK